MPFLLATPVAEAAVATTARVAIPKLVKYLAKNGGDKLIKKYGQNAFEAVLGTTAGVAAYNKTAEKVSGYVDSIGKDTESTSSIPKSSMEGVDRMTQMDAVMAVPNVNKNDSNEEDTVDSNQLTTNQNKDSEPPLNEPPKGPNLGKELATEAVTQATKKLLENKKPDLSKQTKDLVPEKAELGRLSALEELTLESGTNPFIPYPT